MNAIHQNKSIEKYYHFLEACVHAMKHVRNRVVGSGLPINRPLFMHCTFHTRTNSDGAL